MKKLVFITLFFVTTLESQDSLTVTNNSVKIQGYKSVHYIVTNLEKIYIGWHLPILFKVKNKTEWV